MTLLLGAVWVLNLAISFWNAYAVGNAWVEAKHAGGWRRFIAWMGAVMADIGFTWCTLLLIGFGLNAAGILNDVSLELLLNAGYVIIVPILLFAGYAIMLDSWQRAYRERTLSSVGIASWNTFANTYNTYHAVQDWGSAFGKVMDGLSKGSKGKDGAQLVLIVIILAISIGLGTMITYALIQRYAGRDELPPPPTLNEDRTRAYRRDAG